MRRIRRRGRAPGSPRSSREGSSRACLDLVGRSDPATAPASSPRRFLRERRNHTLSGAPLANTLAEVIMISARDLDFLFSWRAPECQSILSLYVDRKAAVGSWSPAE